MPQTLRTPLAAVLHVVNETHPRAWIDGHYLTELRQPTAYVPVTEFDSEIGLLTKWPPQVRHRRAKWSKGVFEACERTSRKADAATAVAVIQKMWRSPSVLPRRARITTRRIDETLVLLDWLADIRQCAKYCNIFERRVQAHHRRYPHLRETSNLHNALEKKREEDAALQRMNPLRVRQQRKMMLMAEVEDMDVTEMKSIALEPASVGPTTKAVAKAGVIACNHSEYIERLWKLYAENIAFDVAKATTKEITEAYVTTGKTLESKNLPVKRGKCEIERNLFDLVEAIRKRRMRLEMKARAESDARLERVSAKGMKELEAEGTEREQVAEVKKNRCTFDEVTASCHRKGNELTTATENEKAAVKAEVAEKVKAAVAITTKRERVRQNVAEYRRVNTSARKIQAAYRKRVQESVFSQSNWDKVAVSRYRKLLELTAMTETEKATVKAKATEAFKSATAVNTPRRLKGAETVIAVREGRNKQDAMTKLDTADVQEEQVGGRDLATTKTTDSTPKKKPGMKTKECISVPKMTAKTGTNNVEESKLRDPVKGQRMSKSDQVSMSNKQDLASTVERVKDVSASDLAAYPAIAVKPAPGTIDAEDTENFGAGDVSQAKEKKSEKARPEGTAKRELRAAEEVRDKVDRARVTNDAAEASTTVEHAKISGVDRTSELSGAASTVQMDQNVENAENSRGISKTTAMERGIKAAGVTQITPLLTVSAAEIIGKQQQQRGGKEVERANRVGAEAQKRSTLQARIGSSLRLPPSRKHIEKKPDEFQIFPLQKQAGVTLMYKQIEWNLTALMNTLRGYWLASGVAPVLRGGVARAAEEFSMVCGFSASFGPLLLRKAVGGEQVYARYNMGYDHMPFQYVMTKFEKFFEKEIVKCDAAERFFRLARKDSHSEHVTRADLHPFILSIAQRHPDLTELSVQEISIYVDTVLATIFYDCSRGGALKLADIRKSDLVSSITYFGSWELCKETTGYTITDLRPRLPLVLRQKVERVWSLSRHKEIRRDFLELCGEGAWNVSADALAGYQQDGHRAVGAVRARRVLNAGLRPFSPGESPGGVILAGKGYGQDLDYDSFVCFYLCEEALRAARCTERDVKYCFNVMDEGARGKIGMAGFDQYLEDAKRECIARGQHVEDIPHIKQVIAQYMDRLGVKDDQEYVTLKDMIKLGNVTPTGRFFEELFSGTDMEARQYIQDSGIGFSTSSPLPVSMLLGNDVYPNSALEFERELAEISGCFIQN